MAEKRLTQKIDSKDALKLCLLEQKCPSHEWTSIPGKVLEDGNQVADTLEPCPTCGNYLSGRIPLLDPKLVRVECDSEECEAAIPVPGEEPECAVCQGRGWIPSVDPWAYVLAAWQEVGFEKRQEVLWAITDSLYTGQDPGAIAFKVVAEALLKGE